MYTLATHEINPNVTLCGKYLYYSHCMYVCTRVDVELGGMRCVWKMDTLVHSNLSETLKPESSDLLTTRIFLAVPLDMDTCKSLKCQAEA